jgi:hypothetical protein
MIWTNGPLGRCPRHSFGMLSRPQALLSFNVYTSLGLTFSRGLVSMVSSTALALACTHCAWFHHTGHGGVKWPPLAFSSRWYLRPRGPWIAVGAHGPSYFRKDLATGQTAWGMTSQLPTFVSHHLSALLWVSLLITVMTQLTANPWFCATVFLASVL